MIRYQFFPRSHGVTEEIKAVINCFKIVDEDISSETSKLNSNEVLEKLRPHLEDIDYNVETGKSKNEKIPVPVLFGYDNEIDKSFNADALSKDGKIVIEVEAVQLIIINS